MSLAIVLQNFILVWKFRTTYCTLDSCWRWTFICNVKKFFVFEKILCSLHFIVLYDKSSRSTQNKEFKRIYLKIRLQIRIKVLYYVKWWCFCSVFISYTLKWVSNLILNSLRRNFRFFIHCYISFETYKHF